MTTKNSFNFCNNCGKPGHVYHNCKMPITSIGFIVFQIKSSSESSTENNTVIKDEVKYLMIRRKDSLGFVDFMRGRYSLSNPDYILNIINEMTVSEKNLLITKDFDELWSALWGSHIGIQYRGEERLSKEKFATIKAGILVENEQITLQDLINKSDTSWTEPEWGFPKGRRNYQEKDLNCALREFEEETGYSKSTINLISNLIPFEEIFTGSNYKSYKHKYFLANISSNAEPYTTFQETEVSRVDWKSYNDCIQCMRPYNLEKREILDKVNRVLERQTLYY